MEVQLWLQEAAILVASTES